MGILKGGAGGSGGSSPVIPNPSFVSTGLIGLYAMNDSGGTDGFTLTDSSGLGNNGTLGDRAPITALSLTTNVITFTAANDYTAGQIVILTGLTVNTFLNGQSVTVLAGGLSSSQFKANFTHADVPSGAETGFATVTLTVPANIAVTGGLSFDATKNQFASLPAAINSMKSMLLVTFFDPNNANDGTFPTPIGPSTGNGGPAIFYTQSGGSAINSIEGSPYYYAQGWNVGGSFAAPNFPAPVAGYLIFSLTQPGAAGDKFYYYTYGGTQNTSTIGTLSSGNYVLGARVRPFNGQILLAAFWNIALSDAQVAQNVQAIQSTFAQRGLILNGIPGGGTWQTPNYIDTYVLDGDSLTGEVQSPNLPTIAANMNVFDNSQSGQTAEQINQFSQVSVDPFLPNIGIAANGGNVGQGANKAAVITMIGTNDSGGSATIPLGSLATYCRMRHLKGWNKVCVCTIPTRNAADAFKNSYNGLIRQYWQDWADCLLDNGAIPTFGADGASNNTSYFSVDQLHLSTTLAFQQFGQSYSWAIRRVYGNGINGTPSTASATVYLVQPEDIYFLIDSSANNVDAYLPQAQYFTGQTITVKNISTGGNTATLRTKPTTAAITNFALTTNVATVTAANHYTAGDVVVLTGLTTTPGLNGQSGIVLATGLSATSFQMNLTHANIVSAAETGVANMANYCQIAQSTLVSESAGNVVTLTINNNFTNGTSIKLSGFTTATWLNGQTVTLSSANATTLTFTDGSAHGVLGSTADVGTCVFNYASETIDGAATLVSGNGKTIVLLSKLSASSTGLANWVTLQNS